MLIDIFPRKIARESNRIRNSIQENSFTRGYYVLRGGFLPFQLLGQHLEFKPLFLSEKYSTELSSLEERDFVLEDMIGTGNTLRKLERVCPNVVFYTLDSTLPQFFYEDLFPGVNFYLPRDMLNIHASRLFENQTELMGIDVDQNGNIIEHTSVVRDKFLSRIKSMGDGKDLEKKFSNLVDWFK